MSEATEHPLAFGWSIGTHAVVGGLLGWWARQWTLPCRYYYDPTYFNFNGKATGSHLLFPGTGYQPDDHGAFVCGIILSGTPEVVGTITGAILGVLVGFGLSIYFDSQPKPA